jgi:phage host-nuclease inhibitor protein Gam
MKLLSITSVEALDAAVASVVWLKVQHTEATATKDSEVVALEKKHQMRIQGLVDGIHDLEAVILDFCQAHRDELFIDKKSRETTLAVIGFELTPYRVEKAKKLKWSDVVSRLLKLSWGKAYVRQPEPQPDKDALLNDREKFKEMQLIAAGIKFDRDEQFFIRPKPETAADSVKEAA